MNRLIRILKAGAVSALLALPHSGSLARETPVVRIGVLLDGPSDLFGTTFTDLLESEIIELNRGEFDIRFPDELQLQGSWNLAGIRSALDRLLEDPRADLVLVVGPFSSAEAARRTALPKPVVAADGIDATSQGFPLEMDDGGNPVSGVKNLNYIAWSGILRSDLARFHELSPFRVVHIIVDPLFYELIPDLDRYTQEQMEELGATFEPVLGVDSATDILDKIPAGAEAVFLTPLPRMPRQELDRLIRGINRKRLPSFSLLGRREVEKGILAGSSPAEDTLRKARRISLNLQRILLGEDAGALPVLMRRLERLTLNMATARAIGFFPRWRFLTEADLLHRERTDLERQSTLSETVREAVTANLDLRAFRRRVAAGEEDIHRARSRFLPQLDLAAEGIRIDEDRASASLGLVSEESWTGSTVLSQLIYSDRVRADVEVNRRLQESREFDRETLFLDIARDSAVAYLEVLRAQTLARIERENLKLTESNLEIARRRVEIGVASRAEEFRWESQLATSRARVIAADRAVDAARAAVNRLLNLPQEQPFLAEDPELEDPLFITSNLEFLEMVDNPWGFARLREFQVREGLAAAPELKAFDAAIAAQERGLKAARRSFWAPDIRLFGEYQRELDRSGEGAAGPALPPGGSRPDENDWQVGVRASLPLFTGGERTAAARQALENLNGLRIERQAAAERIELRIRTTLFGAGASFPGIELSREAALAARRNLDLVTDTYAQGVVSIIDLLDAQNAALVADQRSSNAVFDFLIDLMEVQRATSNFDFFSSAAERSEWFERLKQFFIESRNEAERAGGEP